ncbi:MAG: MFS transporter [Myxococcota bacterium]|nr:MFS transporter [Myxococcota bacterium]
MRRERRGRLSFATKLCQGVGAIPDTVKKSVFNTFTLLYYHQIMDLDALYVSLALAVAILFDAVTDPLVASISDTLKTGPLAGSGVPPRAAARRSQARRRGTRESPTP